MSKRITDVQDLLGLGRDAVKAGILSGELPGYRVGRFWVIPDEAFEALAKGEWTPHPKPMRTFHPSHSFIQKRPAS